MRNRLGYAIMVTLLGTSALLSACNDDEDDLGETNGGENAGGDPSAGGSSAGKAGSTSGGKAGSGAGGGMTDAGAGGMSDAGAGGDDGMGGAGMGGAGAGMGGANVGGAEGGAGGAVDPGVTYACTANSIAHKACSAKAAASCTEGVVCPDCVSLVQEERDGFAECATCLAELDKTYQCAIDAHESGNLSEGVACFPTGPESTVADYSDACYEFFMAAVTCQGYAADPENGCPSTWPPPG